jgi:hypothetical protein
MQAKLIGLVMLQRREGTQTEKSAGLIFRLNCLA